jgi:hypothetical protein
MQKNTIIKIVTHLFASEYSKIISTKNIVIVDSSGEVERGYKYSVNIIFDGYAMADYTEFKWFGQKVAELYESVPGHITGFLDENFCKG